jgi:hypothetical protein
MTAAYRMTVRYRGGRIMARFRFLLLIALACAFAPAAFAQTPPSKAAPESENGRYSMSPVADGVLRLDTRTGQVSLCRQKSDSWICEATADDRAAYDKEIARLQAKVANLEAELKRQPDGGELKLPSDAEVDRVMKFFETVFRRFIGMIEGLQRENEQKRS